MSIAKISLHCILSSMLCITSIVSYAADDDVEASEEDTTIGCTDFTDENTEIEFVCIEGDTFTMGESKRSYEGKDYNNGKHEVTLSTYYMGATEVTNEQYVNFLNAAYDDKLIKVGEFDELLEDGDIPYNIAHYNGKTVAYFTDDADDKLGLSDDNPNGTEIILEGMVAYDLGGHRVLKDHDNKDRDNDPFTGIVEPENPLNIAMIGFDGKNFFIKNPRDEDDIDWDDASDYQDWHPSKTRTKYGRPKNDFDEWSEIQSNREPSKTKVKTWPANFVTWYGAKAFALYYDYNLPSEAQWEFAAMGGDDFYYATHDGTIKSLGRNAVWNNKKENPATGHVKDVKENDKPNPYGLHNMAGNVWEWVDDWYIHYDGDDDWYVKSSTRFNRSTDPKISVDVFEDQTGVKDCHESAEPPKKCLKVYRGGSWNYHKATLKSKARFYDEPWKSIDHFGFRVAKEYVEENE